MLKSSFQHPEPTNTVPLNFISKLDIQSTKSSSVGQYWELLGPGNWFSASRMQAAPMYITLLLCLESTEESFHTTKPACSVRWCYMCTDTCWTCVQPCDMSGTHLDQLSIPKNPYFDTLGISVAQMVQKLEHDLFLTNFMCMTHVRHMNSHVTGV